jgi:hypothetical protein
MGNRLLALGLAAAFGLSVVACGDGGRGAAERGLSSAQAALDAVKTEGSQYAPDLVQDIENSLAAARETFAKGNFRQALAEAQLLPKKMSALDAAVAAKKTELTKEWSTLSASLPEVVDAIQGRVSVLSKAKRLPAGMSREAFDKARSGADEVAKTWAEAGDALTKGNVGDAVEEARAVRARAAEIMAALEMEVPDALR